MMGDLKQGLDWFLEKLVENTKDIANLQLIFTELHKKLDLIKNETFSILGHNHQSYDRLFDLLLTTYKEMQDLKLQRDMILLILEDTEDGFI